MSNLTVADKAVALHFRHPSWDAGEIARAIGGIATRHYVLKIFRRRRIRIANPQRKLLDWERQAVIDACAAGENVKAVADEFGVKPQAIRRAAKKAGKVTA